MLKKFAAAGLALAFLSGIVLAAEYEGDPATLARDVLAFAGELAEAGLLEPAESAP